MSDTDPERWQSVFWSSTGESAWEVEQNQDEELEVDDFGEEMSENFREVYEKAERSLEAAQSEDGPFEFEPRFEEKKIVFTVDPWTVGVVSLDLEAASEEFSSYSPEDSQKSVRITPKIEDADWPAMLALARDWSNVDFSGPRRDANKSEDNLAGFIAYAYDSALEELFTEYGGLRQKHRTVERDLEAEIKGSVRISEYLTNITRGEVTTVPCSFSELTMDNQPNRVLLHALHGAQRLVRDHAGFENKEINRRLLRHRRKFAAVTHERVRPSQLNQLESLPTAFDGYEQSNALEIARYIIEETDLGIETGDYESIELTAVMWRVFENAFAQVVADELDVNRDDIAQDNWTYQIDQDNEISLEQDEDDTEQKTAYRKKQMQPDIYLPSDELEENSKAIVADTKWKQITPFFENKKTVENDDLFQITTYRDVAAQMDDDGEAVGFLVYPFTAENDCSEVPRHEISLSGVPENVGDGDWEDIYVIGWQVGTTGDGTDFNLRGSARKTVGEMIRTATAKDSN